jgi:hypothetical protein
LFFVNFSIADRVLKAVAGKIINSLDWNVQAQAVGLLKQKNHDPFELIVYTLTCLIKK